MKLQRQVSMTKLSNAARDLLVFMARTKLPLLAIGTALVAKCRKLWGGLITRRGEGGACPADDYFRWSYEFSCTATPVNALPVKLKRRPTSALAALHRWQASTGDDAGERRAQGRGRRRAIAGANRAVAGARSGRVRARDRRPRRGIHQLVPRAAEDAGREDAE
ncbi:hypothetical protein PR202_ga01547 [Eleusine coracana subsp. coracana]|uniref:Uncharacterized protein n=1 Tax=Eleusine coracana subsp. coracana TaxID=191504 RepID=A0AAV5BFA0_ELECO|nr:hypothetical protein PR202_ga00860 [Eleusine coracana subsp. coracana]GJM85751.1 hypothetical protein PR202_ga01547 [Eleusine coracana subsp. coracana]